MMNKAAATKVSPTKITVDIDSLEKLVGGARNLTRASCNLLKSSMEFCRSLILRKKSLLRSGAGLTLFGGAIGGPPNDCCRSASPVAIAFAGGGGCRARNAGTMMKNRHAASGITGSK